MALLKVLSADSFSRLALIAAAGTFLAACSSDDGSNDKTTEPGPDAGPLSYQWPTDDWTVSTPEAHGMDPAILEGARNYAFLPEKNTQSVIVIRGGEIVAEWYADGKDEGSWAAAWSSAKSFASTLIGFAIEDGLIESVDVSMAEFYPEWKGTEHETITLKNVLQMQSGLEWNETYFIGSDMFEMFSAKDELAVAKDRQPKKDGLIPLWPPGSKFAYSSADTMLLTGAVEVVTGKSAVEYAREKLFEPIGMSTAQWWQDGVGSTLGYCCIDAPAREFAKFGLLFLRNGEWDGQQLISSGWVSDAVKSSESYKGYGYQWWNTETDPDDGMPADWFSAQGLDYQRIHVIPSLDLVVLRHSLYEKPPGEPIADKGVWRKFVPDLADQLGGVEAPYGTKKPDHWDDLELLRPIVDSVVDPDKSPYTETAE